MINTNASHRINKFRGMADLWSTTWTIFKRDSRRWGSYNNLIIMANIRNVSQLQVCLMLALFCQLALSGPLPSSKCLNLRFQWDQLIQTNSNLLCRMNGQFPLQCLSEKVDLRFPQQVLVASNRGIIKTVHELLQQSLNLLSKDNPYNAWNSRCIENLQNGLYQQIRELETCLDAVNMQNGPIDFENTVSSLSILKVKKYFLRINRFLTEKQNSQCAWEVIHLEMRRCFLFISLLLKNLR